MKNLEATYIAEINLPSFRAYNIHVMKMIDSFSLILNKTSLIIPHKSKKYFEKKIKKDFMLRSKNKINILSIFKKKKKFNFILRIIFGFISAKIASKKDGVIITRSFFSSFFLSIFKKKHFLEVHQEITGLTYLIFIFLKMMKSKYIIKVIFITKSLANFYKKNCTNFLVLADGVDVKNFQKRNKIKKRIINIYYIGSFYLGRGIDLIIDIAKTLPQFKFILVGKRREDKNYLNSALKNVIIKNFIPYHKVPNEIKNADILIMPYKLKNVLVNSKGRKTDISKFTSPIKMFEYLSTGIPIVSANLPVLKEILENKKNCIIVKSNKIEDWANNLQNLSKNYKLRKLISKNAILTANNNTWIKRACKIINSYEK